MMVKEKSYTIGELAEAAGVTTRTVRYYVAENLLPAPEGAGRATTYNDEHLARLKLIKILKTEYLPLHEIRGLLSGLNYQAVLELLEEKQKSESPPPPAPNSAKEYLQTLLNPPVESAQAPKLMRHKVEAQKQRRTRGILGEESRAAAYKIEDDVSPSESGPEPEAKQAPSFALAEETEQARNDVMGLGAGAGSALDSRSMPSSPAPIQPGEAQPLTRWQRIQLTPEVELHVKEGVEKTDLWSKIEQLVKIAQQMLSSII